MYSLIKALYIVVIVTAFVFVECGPLTREYELSSGCFSQTPNWEKLTYQYSKFTFPYSLLTFILTNKCITRLSLYICNRLAQCAICEK